MSTYLVTGRLGYREYRPGEVFEAVLERDVEARALRRGNLELLDNTPPTLQPGSWRIHPSWRPSTATAQEATP